MKVVCSWCKTHMSDKAPFEDNSVSHGMCPGCAKNFSVELETLRTKKASRTLLVEATA